MTIKQSRNRWTTSRRAVLAGLGAGAAAFTLPGALKAQSAGTIKIVS